MLKKINLNYIIFFIFSKLIIIAVSFILAFNTTSQLTEAEKWYETTNISRDSFISNTLLKSFGETPKKSSPVTNLVLVDQQKDAYTYKNPLGEDVPVILLSNGKTIDEIKKMSNIKVIISLHQTNKTGGEEPCGKSNENQPNMFYGKELNDRGYIVFCPTLSFTGSRQIQNQWDTKEFYKKYPNWSAFGKDVAEISWLIDSLKVTGLNISQIAVIGHSQGGLYALFAAALDKRINIVVANAGFFNFKNDPNPERWNRKKWYKALPDIPRDYTLEEVVVTIAPRSVLLNNYLQDEILISNKPYDEVTKLMKFFPSINWAFFSGIHDFPPEVKDFSFSWLSKQIFRQ
jgi:hypothetical protein